MRLRISLLGQSAQASPAALSGGVLEGASAWVLVRGVVIQGAQDKAGHQLPLDVCLLLVLSGGGYSSLAWRPGWERQPIGIWNL